MGLIFEWDENKANTNIQKHKVSFEEAKTVFSDPYLLTFYDAEHSGRERRYINIGVSLKQKVLVVIHTERQERIRIISCRKATKSERQAYEEGRVGELGGDCYLNCESNCNRILLSRISAGFSK